MRTLLIALAAASAAGTAPASAQMMGRDPAAMLDHADKDGDGRISRDEFIAARAATFAKFDRNGDGVITRDDFKRILKFRRQAATRIDAMFAEMDADHDGRITRAELAAAPTLLFDRADSNHDGFVDKTELAGLRAAMQQMRQGQ